ncbi:MAG: Asp-tRNA(Asn)/Glu-tRNA(Gln) amidotransferase subunit GatA [Bacilli bacterium]
MNNYLDLSINEIHDLLVKKTIKPIDLVNEAFTRIDNDDLNCFITLDKEGAINRAKSLEDEVPDNILWGIPIALKDNIMTKGIRTTAGSKMLCDFVPVYSAHVVDLINKKGMIIVGKLNMDEFAMGSSNQTSYFGPVKNPWNKSLVSGGSSGGSAASISSRLVPFTLGSDTGGSIRQPSAFCGTVGLKPTYGRVSRYGLIAFASSLDQIGPITRNVLDNALLLNILCEKDERDLTQIGKKEDFTSLIGEDISGMKIAIPKFYISDVIDKQILDKFNSTISLLKEKGCTVDVIDIPYIDYSVSLYQVIALGEASSNLARFDGIKYGYSTGEFSNTDEFYSLTRSEGFGDEVKRRIMIGSFMLSGENVSEYYTKALKIRKSIALEFEKVFDKYDLVIGPTTTCLPYEIGDLLDDPNKSFVDDILSIPVNMAGLPGLSMPIGFSKDHLPIGMQIIGNKWDEKTIYKLASFIEKELNLNLNPGGDNHE